MGSQVGDGLYSDPSQIIKASLPDVPSDLALSRYNIPTTYTTLHDVLASTRAEHSQTPRSIRHDSHQPLSDADKLDDYEQLSEAVVQKGQNRSASNDEDDSYLEINLNGLSTDSTDASTTSEYVRRGRSKQRTPKSGESAQVDGACHSGNIMTNRVQNVLDNLTPTGCSGSEPSDSESSPCGHKRKKPRPSRKHQQPDHPCHPAKVITTGVQDVLDNLTSEGCSGSDYWESEDEDYHLVRKPHRDSHEIYALRNTEESPQSYPSIPPEPSLKPLLFDQSTIPSYPLDGNIKRHVRARTYPLRTHPEHQLTASDHENHQTTTTRRTARRFTSFNNLPAPKFPPNPPKPTTRIEVHPHAHPQGHLSALLPLPHRRPSNPPPPLNPAQDAFYHALKSKLWDLARELETLQPGEQAANEAPEAPSPDLDDDEVSVVFKLDLDDEDAERDAGDGDVDTNTSNSGSDSGEEEEEDTDSENTIRRQPLPRAERRKGGTLRRISRPRADGHESSDAGTGSESLCGSDVEELVDWVRAKPALECLQRRRSEGRGRQRARERAASLRERLLRAGPD
ncbi:hypothetical protein BU16DRAFT_534486 [Lophium mytilinum]|uniref:Uncharacterized protein n=1 Tax=Lophium mytilinum TaxID=390894 RepID=A0A6A6RAN5_9PEZI|nr:hypothetical protein BU16DRAFT_534486 [Lophium mytilinum]